MLAGLGLGPSVELPSLGLDQGRAQDRSCTLSKNHLDCLEKPNVTLRFTLVHYTDWQYRTLRHFLYSVPERDTRVIRLQLWGTFCAQWNAVD